jgi:hypothetical protein
MTGRDIRRQCDPELTRLGDLGAQIQGRDHCFKNLSIRGPNQTIRHGVIRIVFAILGCVCGDVSLHSPSDTVEVTCIPCSLADHENLP